MTEAEWGSCWALMLGTWPMATERAGEPTRRAWLDSLRHRDGGDVLAGIAALAPRQVTFPALADLHRAADAAAKDRRLTVPKLPPPRARRDWESRIAALPPERYAEVKRWVAAECPSLAEAARGVPGMIGRAAAQEALRKASVVLAERADVRDQADVARAMLPVAP